MMHLSPAIEKIEPVSDAEESDDDVQEIEGPAPEYHDDEQPAADGDQEVPEAGAQVSVFNGLHVSCSEFANYSRLIIRCTVIVGYTD